MLRKNMKKKRVKEMKSAAFVIFIAFLCNSAVCLSQDLFGSESKTWKWRGDTDYFCMDETHMCVCDDDDVMPTCSIYSITGEPSEGTAWQITFTIDPAAQLDPYNYIAIAMGCTATTLTESGAEALILKYYASDGNKRLGLQRLSEGKRKMINSAIVQTTDINGYPTVSAKVEMSDNGRVTLYADEEANGEWTKKFAVAGSNMPSGPYTIIESRHKTVDRTGHHYLSDLIITHSAEGDDDTPTPPDDGDDTDKEEEEETAATPMTKLKLSANSRVIIPEDGGRYAPETLRVEIDCGTDNVYATLRIFDAYGRRIATPENNRPLSSAEGTLVWDGRREDGAVVRPGTYIAVVSAWDTTGRERISKVTVTVTHAPE